MNLSQLMDRGQRCRHGRFKNNKGINKCCDGKKKLSHINLVDYQLRTFVIPRIKELFEREII